MQDITALTEQYRAEAHKFAQENIFNNTPRSRTYYDNILSDKLAGYNTSCKQWLFLIQLRDVLNEFKEARHRENVIDTPLTNSYACTIAYGNELAVLTPYLESGRTEEADEFSGIELAKLQDRIDEVKALLKKTGINDQAIFEDITDLITYAHFGKRRFAQLTLGAIATMVADGQVTPELGDKVCSIIILGIDEGSTHLKHAVSFTK